MDELAHDGYRKTLTQQNNKDETEITTKSKAVLGVAANMSYVSRNIATTEGLSSMWEC